MRMSEALKREVLKVYLKKRIKKYYNNEMVLLESHFRDVDDGSLDFCFTIQDSECTEYWFEIYDLYYYSENIRDLDQDYIKGLINSILEEFERFLSIKEWWIEEDREDFLDIDSSLRRDEILDEFDITEDGNFHEKKGDPVFDFNFEVTKENGKYVFKYFEESSFSWIE